MLCALLVAQRRCTAVQAVDKVDEQAFTEQPSSELNRQQADPDSAFLQDAPLWAAYRMCAARARRNNAARKLHSMALLASSDEHRMGFGREARATIDPKIIARVRCGLPHTDAVCFLGLQAPFISASGFVLHSSLP